MGFFDFLKSSEGELLAKDISSNFNYDAMMEKYEIEMIKSVTIGDNPKKLTLSDEEISTGFRYIRECFLAAAKKKGIKENDGYILGKAVQLLFIYQNDGQEIYYGTLTKILDDYLKN